MNEPVADHSYESVSVKVTLKRPRWSSQLNFTTQQAEEVIDYLTHHPEVEKATTEIESWFCPVCNKLFYESTWRENKTNAGMCCYE